MSAAGGARSAPGTIPISTGSTSSGAGDRTSTSAGGFRLDLLGVVVEVVVGDPELLAAAAGATADLHDPVRPARAAHGRVELSVGPDGRFELRHDGTVVADGLERVATVPWLLWLLNRIAARAPGVVTVHAGAVLGPSGVIVLPGQPGAGKSTLTAALVANGYGYLSDELAGLAETLGGGLAVRAFHRPLALHPASVRALAPWIDPPRNVARERAWLAPADALRPGSRVAGGRPAVLVFPRHRRDGIAGATPVAPIDALVGLLAQCPDLAAQGARAVRVLVELAATCPAWALEHDHLGRAVDEVAALVAEAAEPERVPAGPALRVVTPTPAADAPAVARGPRPAPGVVVVEAGSELVVFVPATAQTHRTNASGAAVFRAATGERTEHEIVASVVAGAVPGGDGDTEALVRADAAAVLRRWRAVGALA